MWYTKKETQLQKLLIFRDTHGTPADLFENVIISLSLMGAQTDPLEEMLIFAVQRRALSDL